MPPALLPVVGRGDSHPNPFPLLCTPEFCVFAVQNHEREVDHKDGVLQQLDRDLEDSEEQYQAAVRGHLLCVDSLLDLQYQVGSQRELCQSKVWCHLLQLLVE